MKNANESNSVKKHQPSSSVHSANLLRSVAQEGVKSWAERRKEGKEKARE
jgi:hypothetical protein